MLKTPKIRSRKHLMFIASLPCIICGGHEVQAAHIRSGNNAGVGLKSGDDNTMPLCLACHSLQHSMNERKFWDRYGGFEKARNIAKTLYAFTGKKQDALRIIGGFK